MENRIQSKIDDIQNKIKKNIASYDLNQIYKLLSELDNNLITCIKIDYEVLEFFRNKSNFRIIQDLRDFSFKKLKYNVKGKRRVEIEEELAQYVCSRSIKKEELLNLLEKSEIKERILKPKTILKKKEIEDQTARWISLTLNELKEELNDLEKYPDSTMLKKAAYSILLPNEKRLRKRQKLIQIIINRITEDKAIAHLGR